jgi:hypothetical protein
VTTVKAEEFDSTDFVSISWALYNFCLEQIIGLSSWRQQFQQAAVRSRFNYSEFNRVEVYKQLESLDTVNVLFQSPGQRALRRQTASLPTTEPFSPNCNSRCARHSSLEGNFYQASIYAWNPYRDDKTITNVTGETTFQRLPPTLIIRGVVGGFPDNLVAYE